MCHLPRSYTLTTHQLAFAMSASNFLTILFISSSTSSCVLPPSFAPPLPLFLPFPPLVSSQSPRASSSSPPHIPSLLHAGDSLPASPSVPASSPPLLLR